MQLNLLNKIKTAGYFACLLLGIAFGLIAMPAYRVVAGIFGGRKVQTICSHAGSCAVLYKQHNLADINFKVGVNGQTVYTSPDVMPFPDGMYRETLVWDETGRVVVLELMNKRVFAYDTVEQRRLGKGELSQYKLYPTTSEYVYVDLKDIDDETHK
jgi:hypothetical protein